MSNKIKLFVRKHINLYGFTIFIGIIATLCLICFGEMYYEQGKDLFNKYNFKFYIALVLAVGWLFFYVIYLHKQFIQFIKFVIDEKIITDKKIEKLNRNTRNLIVLHSESNKEDGVA